MGPSGVNEIAFDDDERRAATVRRPRRANGWRTGAALAMLLAVGAVAWWYRFGRVEPPPVPAAVSEPAVPARALPAAPAASVRYPVDTAASPPLPSLERADRFVAEALGELLGRPAAQAGIVIDGFLRRFVATLDNLARDHAAPSMWPVQRTPGRLTIERAGERLFIGADNARRYAGLVQLLERVDIARAVALYRSLYPLLQQAYEEVGFPGAYFNDRLVQVIDHLLAAPEPEGPVEVRLVEIRGPVKTNAPWLHYEFADPELERLSAGQKIMVRVGLDNERRLKARLAAVRAALVGGRSPQPQPAN